MTKVIACLAYKDKNGNGAVFNLRGFVVYHGTSPTDDNGFVNA